MNHGSRHNNTALFKRTEETLLLGILMPISSDFMTELGGEWRPW